MATGQRVRMDIKKYRCCLTKREWTELCSAWMQEYADYKFAWPDAGEDERVASANRRAEQFFKVLISRRLILIHRGDEEGFAWMEDESREQELSRSES